MLRTSCAPYGDLLEAASRGGGGLFRETSLVNLDVYSGRARPQCDTGRKAAGYRSFGFQFPAPEGRHLARSVLPVFHQDDSLRALGRLRENVAIHLRVLRGDDLPEADRVLALLFGPAVSDCRPPDTVVREGWPRPGMK